MVSLLDSEVDGQAAKVCFSCLHDKLLAASEGEKRPIYEVLAVLMADDLSAEEREDALSWMIEYLEDEGEQTPLMLVMRDVDVVAIQKRAIQISYDEQHAEA